MTEYILDHSNLGICENDKIYFLKIYGSYSCVLCGDIFKNGGVIYENKYYHIECFRSTNNIFVERIYKYLLLRCLEK